MKNILTVVLIVFAVQMTKAQNYKFGKVSKEELEEKVFAQDSSANAAYLYKKRRTYTIVDASGIKLKTDVHVRLKIYNTDGFDWATESIYLSISGGTEERISSVKAITYNLVDGAIEETKLGKKDVFSEEVSKSLNLRKFTMPNIKEGSVLEWTYSIHSPFFASIDDVDIQYEIPVKKYVTKIELLEWFKFNKRQRGFYPFKIQESSKRNPSFDTNDRVVLIDEENIPALKAEPFVNNMHNYSAGLELEVASLTAPSLQLYENYATSWEDIAKNIYKSSGFGGELKKSSHLKEDIELIQNKSTNAYEKIAGALQMVKSKIKWNGNLGEYPENGLKKAYKEGAGNIGDINLTLVVILRELGLDADPVLISTRSNGVPLFPTSKGINYVGVTVRMGEDYILLDASEKYSLPNLLPLRAVNWNGIVVEEGGKIDYVDLSNTLVSLEESNLKYKIDADGFAEGMNRVKYENLSSINYRNSKAELLEEDLISRIEESNDAIEIVNFRLSNKNDIGKPVMEMYTFEKEDAVEVIGDKMYLNPMLFNVLEENPFKLETREYPVDFGTPWKDKCVIDITIPEGFQVESVPESIGYALSDELGTFIYSIKNKGNKVRVSSTVEIKQGVIPAMYYEELKGFFKEIVSKQTEKVVLSKI